MHRSHSVLKTIFLLSRRRPGTRNVVSRRSCQSVAESSRNVALKGDSAPALDIVKEYNIPIERVSLSRGLALNRFEKDFFIYPEYIDTDAAENALRLVCSLKEDISATAVQKASLANLWNKHNLSSYTVPKKYGGVDMCYKDLLTICEGLGSDWGLYARFEQTYLAAMLILLYGNEQQKTLYLPQIASGAIRPAVCLSEPQMNSNFDSMTAVCELIDDVQKLTATKQHILNASDANLLLVFAKQDVNNVTCYLVERKNDSNVEARSKTSVFGRQGLEVHTLDFKGTIVGPDSMLGKIEDGIKIAQKASSRSITFGAAVVGFMKALLSGLSKYCNMTVRENGRLAEQQTVKHLMTMLALNTYTLESMCYYVGGLYDEELVLLVDVEEAVIHKYARKLLSEAISSTIDVMGMDTVTSGMNFDGILNDVMAALLLSSTELDLDNYVASKVITSYANTNADKIKLWRSFDGRYYDRIFGQAEKAVSFYDPKLKHFLAEHAHPSLKEACIYLENTMWRLESLLDLLLSKHGKSIISDSTILGAISKVVEYNLGMVTVIARSSRSYSIGLRNGDLEISWANLYCSEAANGAIAELRKIYDFFRYERLNPLHSDIGQTVLDAGGYCIESPITRNW